MRQRKRAARQDDLRQRVSDIQDGMRASESWERRKRYAVRSAVGILGVVVGMVGLWWARGRVVVGLW